jgi:hypothetical protein
LPDQLIRSRRSSIVFAREIFSRANARLTDVAINTVVKLLCEAGNACSDYQDKVFRNLKCRLLQMDEARMPRTRVTGNGSLPLFEIARVFVRFDHFASRDVNANHSVTSSAASLRGYARWPGLIGLNSLASRWAGWRNSSRLIYALMFYPKKAKIDTADRRSHCEVIIARSMRLPDLSVSFRQTYTSSLAQSLNSNLQLQLETYENSPSNQ